MYTELQSESKKTKLQPAGKLWSSCHYNDWILQKEGVRMLGGRNVLGTEQRDGLFSAQQSMCDLHKKCELCTGCAIYQMFGVPGRCRKRSETESVCRISFAFCILIK
jgi:hypothetical protein